MLHRAKYSCTKLNYHLGSLIFTIKYYSLIFREISRSINLGTPGYLLYSVHMQCNIYLYLLQCNVIIDKTNISRVNWDAFFDPALLLYVFCTLWELNPGSDLSKRKCQQSANQSGLCSGHNGFLQRLNFVP